MINLLNKSQLQKSNILSQKMACIFASKSYLITKPKLIEMKKLTFFVALLMLVQLTFAGGLLTNTNQSAQFIRMMSRNASLGIDAVYFNPAGLIKLEDGWHFAVYNQSIFQDKTVDSQFPLLNNSEYIGKVSAPVFPTAFAVYKMEDWAFSLGFGPNGGGGSADFDKGLPTFEIPVSKVVPALAGLTQISPLLAVNGYDANISFSGSSIFWGIQLGATYNVSDMFSVYGGVRYLPSKNTYEGSIQNIQLQVAGQNIGAPTWLTQTADFVSGLAAQASAAVAQLSGTASNLQPLIDGGAGVFTLAQLEGNGFIDATTRAQLEAGLESLGLTSSQYDAMSVSSIQGTFSTAADTYGAQATQLTGTAAELSGTAALLGDKAVDTEQTGAGFTPMIGVNISPNEDWNFAVKYEMKTKLELTNDTKVDDVGLFPDGEIANSDIPALLGVGIGYRGLDWLEAQLSFTHYGNKGVEWGTNTRDAATQSDPTKIRTREIDKNGYEIGLGLQFNIADNFAVSVGGLMGDMGVAESYQSDFSYSNPSTTIGAGLMWKITDNLTLDAGFSNTFYEDQTVSYNDPDLGNYSDVLGKTTMNFAAGLSYSIF